MSFPPLYQRSNGYRYIGIHRHRFHHLPMLCHLGPTDAKMEENQHHGFDESRICVMSPTFKVHEGSN